MVNIKLVDVIVHCCSVNHWNPSAGLIKLQHHMWTNICKNQVTAGLVRAVRSSIKANST